MNANLDLTKILEGCPRGTKFYNIIFGDVYLSDIILDQEYPIIISAGMMVTIPLTKEGKYSNEYDGECTLFPSKDQRDWSKFVQFWDKSKAQKFDVNTLHPFDKVLVRDFLSDKWMTDFFEKIEENNEVYYNAVCTTSHWVQCIPYNEKTKHLLNTTENCPDFYKWWED